MSARTTIICNGCAKSLEVSATKTGRPRPPQGWKRDEESYFCPLCWGERYVLRAVTVPIAFPIGRKSKELWMALGGCWQQSTQLANFAVTELAKADIVRSDETRLPAAPKLYLYPQARLRLPEMSPQSVASVLQSAERRYRRRRYEVIWQAKAGLPRHRYPVPYPVHNQAWSVNRDKDGRSVLHVRLSGESWDLALRGGYHFHRQMKMIDQIISGEARQGELAFYRTAVNTGDHRSGKKPYRLMAKLVAWLPRQPLNGRALKGSVLLSTGTDYLWRLHDGSEEEDDYIIYADQMRSWIKAHQRYLKRVGSDVSKLRFVEQGQGISAKLAQEREARCRKQHNRIHSGCQMWAAAVAKKVHRRRFAQVEYDDAARGYFAQFDYTLLRGCLEKALDDYGIHLVASAKVVTESTEGARNGEVE
jgi:hypothetical protein